MSDPLAAGSDDPVTSDPLVEADDDGFADEEPRTSSSGPSVEDPLQEGDLVDSDWSGDSSTVDDPVSEPASNLEVEEDDAVAGETEAHGGDDDSTEWDESRDVLDDSPESTDPLADTGVESETTEGSLPDDESGGDDSADSMTTEPEEWNPFTDGDEIDQVDPSETGESGDDLEESAEAERDDAEREGDESETDEDASAVENTDDVFTFGETTEE